MKKFDYNTEVFDYWPIYRTISHYYPIGIPFNEKDYALYKSYPGSIERLDLILENIHDNKNFKTRWKTFERHVKADLKKNITGTTYAQAPSFSSSLIISDQREKGIFHSKELHFAVSLLGPYYTIYGLDSTAVQLKASSHNDAPDGWFTTHNAITVSPFAEYKELFTRLEEKIRERFPGYRLVPFEISKMSIPGLQVEHCNRENSRIFNALFHDNHDLDIDEWRCRGNRFYGTDEWRILPRPAADSGYDQPTEI